jgi:chaperonin GroES
MFKPLGDYILVKRTEVGEPVFNGIIIPETVQEKPMEGVVIAVGPGKRDKKGNRKAIPIQEGERLLFGKWAGQDVKLNDEEYTIIERDGIVGILRERA